MVELKKLL
jgi:hypothetical protein